MSWKQWDQGEIVEAGDFQEFIQDQVVQSYANDSERNTTLGTAVKEGMISYREDANVVEVYDGSQWVRVGEEGDITAVTAGTALTGGGTAGDVTLDVDETALTIAQSQVTDLVSDLADKQDDIITTQGDLVTGDASGDPIRLAIGTADQVLTSDGTALTWADASAGGDLTGGTAGYTALSNGTAGLSYQPISHNYIINGAFDIWQRGDSFSLTTDEYSADRWLAIPSAGGATVVYSKEAFTLGELPVAGYGEGESYLRISNPGGAGAAGRVRQPIEQLQTLSGNIITLSFYAKADGTKTIRSRIFQDFGSGGSSAVNFSEDVTLSTSWQRFTQTVTLPSLSGKTFGSNPYLGIELLSEIDQAIDFDLWGVQLEAGSIATPFKRNANSIAGELAACQRYYLGDISFAETLFAGYVRTNTTSRITIPTPVQMRATPSIPANLTDSDRLCFVDGDVDDATYTSLGVNSTGVTLEATHSSQTSRRPLVAVLNNLTLDAEL